MDENIEAEVRLLVRQVSERATQGGGMDHRTYEVLIAAAEALSALVLTGESEGREEALRAVQVRLNACRAEDYDKAA